MDEKARLREEVLARRDREPDRRTRSERIVSAVLALEEYRAARLVSWFVGVRSEVETLPAIERELLLGRAVALPFVEQGTLRLARVESVEEIGPAPFALLEPVTWVRGDESRRVSADAVDVFVVPGVAFDGAGGRLGHGKGYYDGLLAGARSDALFVAAAFDCQVVDVVPMTAHDVRMHRLVTESGVRTTDDADDADRPVS